MMGLRKLGMDVVPRGVTAAGLKWWALITLAVSIRAASIIPGWFYWDDFILSAQARESSSWISPHDGHVMIAARAFYSLLPLNWASCASILIALNIAAVISVGWMCRVVSQACAHGETNARVHVLPGCAVVVYALSPCLLPTAWLAVGLTVMPVHICLCLAITLACRHQACVPGAQVPGPTKTKHALALGAVILCAGLFSERALAIGPLVIVVCWALGFRRRLDRAIIVSTLLPTLVLTAGYLSILAYWGQLPAAQGWGIGGGLGDALSDAVSCFWQSIVPTWGGGPWVWQRWVPSAPFAVVSWWPPLLGLGLGVLILACSPRRRAWLPAVLFPVAPVIALLLARDGGQGAIDPQVVAGSLRPFTELAVLHALGLSAQTNKDRPVALALQRLVALRPLLAAIWAGGALASTVAYCDIWWQQPARQYVGNLRADSRKVLEQEATWEVLSPLAYPYNQISTLLPGKVASQISQPLLVDGQGLTRDAEFIGLRTATANTAQCSTDMAQLDGPLLDRQWYIQINYMAFEPGSAEVAVGGSPVEFAVEQGLHQVYVKVTGGGSTVKVTPVSGNQNAGWWCLGDIHVGTFVIP